MDQPHGNEGDNEWVWVTNSDLDFSARPAIPTAHLSSTSSQQPVTESQPQNKLPRSQSHESPARQRRIKQEALQMIRDPPPFCSGGLVDSENLFHWHATIIGPTDTPFAGGIFHLDIHLPRDYPADPPQIKFETPIYHPNIDTEGNISIDILHSQWCPVWTIDKLLLALVSFLDDPNPDDPLIDAIAHIYKTDRCEYDRRARECTRKYAM